MRISPLPSLFQSPWQVFQSVHQNSHACFFLDSGSFNPPNQRFSCIGFDPFLELTLGEKELRLSGELKEKWPASQFLPVFRRLLRKYRSVRRSEIPLFFGGAVGFLGYETAELFDKIRFRRKPGMEIPRAYFGFYRNGIVYDHKLKKY